MAVAVLAIQPIAVTASALVRQRTIHQTALTITPHAHTHQVQAISVALALVDSVVAVLVADVREAVASEVEEVALVAVASEDADNNGS